MSNLELLPEPETCPEIDTKKEKKQLSDPPGKDDDGSEAAAASMKDTKHQAPKDNDEKEEKEGKSLSLTEDDYATELQMSNHTQGEVVPVGVDWMSVAVVLLSVLVAVLLVRKYQRHNG